MKQKAVAVQNSGRAKLPQELFQMIENDGENKFSRALNGFSAVSLPHDRC